MKYTFPYWGNYTIAIKALLEKFGADFIPPQRTTIRDIEEGSEISPDLFCFPFKVNMGNYLDAIRRGADKIVMVENVRGSCRLRYYGEIQKKALAEAGHQIDLLPLRTSLLGIYQAFRELSQEGSVLKILSALYFSNKKLKLIEKLEKKANYLRPREKNKGEVSKVFKEAMEKIDAAKTNKEFFQAKKEVLRRFKKIDIWDKDLPKIGLIGEIYVVSDESVNQGIEEKLAREGIEVHRDMNLSYHINKSLIPWKNWWIQKKAKPYLKSDVGGHGIDAVYEMLNYSKKNYNGVIQLLPLGCMPEITVRPILEKIHQQNNIPFLSLSLDEQVADTGFQTRIEAFAEVVKTHFEKQKKKKTKK